MPSSLIVVGLVVAWLVVLVPMVVRKRQEIARTTDSALAARVVRSGGAEVEEGPMLVADEVDEELEARDEAAQRVQDSMADRHDASVGSSRSYRPGRGGFNPEAAAISARAKYAFRQRVVLLLLLGMLVSGVVAGALFPMVWWGHAALDVLLVGYLTYLRRQVRIEQAVRARRLARMRAAQREAQQSRYVEFEEGVEQAADDGDGRRELVADGVDATMPRASHPNAVVVDVDDEDPVFDELDEPGDLSYRRAAGE